MFLKSKIEFKKTFKEEKRKDSMNSKRKKKNNKKKDDKQKRVDKKIIFYKLLFFLLIALILTYLSFNKLNIQGNVIINPESGEEYFVSEDIPFLYNLSINNTETDPLSNISQLNITFPENFFFVLNSNGTNSLEEEITFQNNSKMISWTKDNLISNSSKINFWFNLTANKTGFYNLTISTLNLTGYSNKNISINVNDTTKPSILFYESSDSNNSAYSKDYIRYNFSTYDKNNISSIYIYLYNSSLNLINSNNLTNVNNISKNISGNFSNLAQGLYYLNISVNDTTGNRNSTGLMNILLHTTPPIITLILPQDNGNITSSPVNFSFNLTSGIDITNCKLIIDKKVEKTIYNPIVNFTNTIKQIIGNGTQEWKINCTDIAGNQGNSSERTFYAYIDNESNNLPSVTNNSGTNTSQNMLLSSSNNTSNQSTNFINYTKITINESELKNEYTSQIKEKTELNFNISNSSHSLKIENISNHSINILLQSTPQEADIKIGEEKKFDVSNDSFYDLKIKLNSINNSEANISLKQIHEKIMSNNKDNSFIIILIIIALLILVIIGLVLFLKFGKKKKEDEYLEEETYNQSPPSGYNPTQINPQQPRFINSINPDLEKLKNLAGS